MTDSLAHWLQLREAADWAARSVDLTQAVAAALPVDGAVHVLDLGTGTGANVRYLIDHLPRRQRWLVVDRSPDLLALVTDRTTAWAAARGHHVNTHATGLGVRHELLDCEIDTLQRDLHTLDDTAMFLGRHLVTASALLDLVSEQWLQTLAARCLAVGAAALFSLTYNGQSSCSPVEPEDDLVRDLLNRHQKTDKGLGGPAAGPDAAACAERCFTAIGYAVRMEDTDWDLGPAQHEMQRDLVAGWSRAASALAPDWVPAIASWRARRMGHIDAGRSRIVVGHHDLAAWPARQS